MLKKNGKKYKMNREECEAKILEKLKEIREITRQYDKSGEIHLSMCIIDEGDNYMHCFSLNEDFPLDITFMKGKVVQL